VHALVYVVDATAPDRLRDSKDAFDSMVDSHLANNLPILVLVNKCDVDGAMSISEVKEVFNESAPKLGVRDCKVMQASAITG
jgi:ADP-ribosylation factor related protein 1